MVGRRSKRAGPTLQDEPLAFLSLSKGSCLLHGTAIAFTIGSRIHIRNWCSVTGGINIMVKTFVVATLAVIGLGISSQGALAGHRSRCCQPQPACCCATTCCAAGSTAPAAPAPPTTAQAGAGAGGYQSFSYEPGASAATPVAAPITQARPTSRSFYDQIRGDRKARGIY